jgi:RND family efflux transporter MFP subunit
MKRAMRMLLWGAGVFFLAGCAKKEEKKPEPPIFVKAGRVEARDLPEVLRFTGDVEGEAEVQIYATVPDRIKAIYADVGDEVKQGQLLAVIEHTRLTQAVAQAVAQLAATKAQLAGAKVNLSGAQVAQASAQRELVRLRRLLKSGAVGQQQVDQLQTQYDSAVTQVQAAKAQISALQAQIRSLDAAVAQAQTSKQNAIVRSPIKGLLARRFRQIGDMASAQLPLFVVADMNEVKVQINVTERDLMKLRIGDKASVQVAAYPNRVFIGRVHKVAPTLDLDTRSAPVELRIANVYPHPKKLACDEKPKKGEPQKCPTDYTCREKSCVELHPLKPGMIAKVSILVKVHRNALMIPLTALLNNSFGYSAALQQKDLAVYTLDEQERPQRQPIRIGLESDDNHVQVLSGLRQGQRLIIEGHNLYKEGAKIKVLQEDKEPTKPTQKPLSAKDTALR